MAMWRHLCLLCVTICLNAGCAITYEVNQDLLPAEDAKAMIEPWPLDIGLYIPPALHDRVIGHQAWRMPIGKSLTSNFEWTLQRMFRRVELLQAPPSGRNQRAELAATIELADVDYRYGVPGSLSYNVVLYSRQGTKLDAWTVTSSLALWDLDASSFWGSMYSVSSELPMAMRNVTAQFMAGFAERPAVRALLTAQGLPPEIHAANTTPPTSSHRPKILLIPNIASWLHTDSARAMDCIGHRLQVTAAPFEIIPVSQVRLQFFPWLEPAIAPKTTEALHRWLEVPAVREQMRALGVRYLLEFHGATRTEMPGGGIVCGAGYGAGGCLGFAWGNRSSSFQATLLDIRAEHGPIMASATQQSHAYLPALILPIPIIAATETNACQALSKKILNLLAQDATTAPQ